MRHNARDRGIGTLRRTILAPPSEPGGVKREERVSSTTQGVTWALFGAWLLFLIIFLAKFHSFVNKPVADSGGGGGGGIFLALSQVALAAAVLLIWRSSRDS